jgi:DNA uptake protein ComE-like DNA-binding protein
MLTLRPLLAGAAVVTLALAPRAARGQDTSRAAGSGTHSVAPNPYAKAAPTDKKTDAPKLNINTAGKDSLMTLKGIGDAYADAIIKGRPYKKKKELVERNIIPAATYAEIKEKITAKHKGS